MRINFFKIEGALPVFSGILGAMFICALIAVHGPGTLGRSQPAHTEEDAGEFEPEIFPPQFSPQEASLSLPREPDGKDILDLYRNSDYRDRVVSFFGALCGSLNVAAVILANAAVFDISPSLAFALSWEESRYNPLAINRKNRDGSIDRGLFQLNDRSFPNIEHSDFFNPSINAWYGMGHLKLCLDLGGTEVAALAMYNAGTGRVRTLGAPKNTLDYIYRILERRQNIEGIFQAEFYVPVEWRLAEARETGEPPEAEDALSGHKPGMAPAIASVRPARFRLVRLAPLLGNR
jgi:hypothetical protein